MYRSGLIESWGRGTLKIAELMLAAGLPAPEIEDAAGCVTVRLRPSRYEPPQRVAHDLSAPQRAVLAALEGAPEGLALREVRALLGSRCAGMGGEGRPGPAQTPGPGRVARTWPRRLLALRAARLRIGARMSAPIHSKSHRASAAAVAPTR